jgi:gas vesicle protein
MRVLSQSEVAKVSKENGLPMFLAGCGIGVAVTLLLVPNSGRELRRRVRRGFRDAGEDLHDRVAMATSGMEGTLRKGAETISDVRNSLKEKIDDTSERAKAVVDKVADKTQDAVHAAAESIRYPSSAPQDA